MPKIDPSAKADSDKKCLDHQAEVLKVACSRVVSAIRCRGPYDEFYEALSALREETDAIKASVEDIYPRAYCVLRMFSISCGMAHDHLTLQGFLDMVPDEDHAEPLPFRTLTA